MLRETSTEGTRYYETVCIVSLGLLFLLLLERGLGGQALVPLLVGVGGLVGRGRWGGQPLVLWRVAPAALLICLAIFLGRAALFDSFWGRPAPLWADALLAVATLGYVAGHYRLQGLDPSPLPADPRQPAPRAPTPRPVPAGEVAALVLELLLWTVLAILFWSWLPRNWYDLGLDPNVWRAMLLIWLIGIGVLLVGSILIYLGRLRMSRGEAELMLQDIFWRETRREQRRLGRWAAWSRKKVGSDR